MNLLLVDDNNFFLKTLSLSLLHIHPEWHIDTLTNPAVVAKKVAKKTYDVLIFDYNFNGIDLFSVVPDTVFKDNCVIVLTSVKTNYTQEMALKKGVQLVCSKNDVFDHFEKQILITHENYLTKQHTSDFQHNSQLKITNKKKKILITIYNNLNQPDAALSEMLNISVNTFKTHKKQLFEITNTQNTAELIKFCILEGIILNEELL